MIIRFSIAAAIAASLLVSFLVTLTSDETVVRGTSAVIRVWDPGEDFTTAEARDAVKQAAIAGHLTLYRVVDGPVSGRPTRTLEVVTRGADTTLPQPDQTYRDFSSRYFTRFASPPEGSRPQPGGGTFITGADAAAVEVFVDTLSAQGMQVSSRSADLPSLLLWTAEITPLIPIICAAFLSVLLGCFHDTIVARRRDAILVAHGLSRLVVVARHPMSVLATALVSGAIGLLLCLPCLGAYNGFAQIDLFYANAVLGIIVVAGVATLATFAVAVMESRGHVRAALAGRRPLRLLAGVGLASHAIALCLVFVVLGVTLIAGIPATANRADGPEWRRATGITKLGFQVTTREFDPNEKAIGTLGRQALSDGDAFLTVGSVGETNGYGPSGGNSILVDNGFVARQHLVLADSSHLTKSNLDPRALTLLGPSDIRVNRRQLTNEFREWLHYAAASPHTDQGLANAPIHWLHLAPEQRVFNYSTGELVSRQLDPVVAVFPSAIPIPDDEWLASEMTTGGVLFTDTTTLYRGLEKLGLAQNVVPRPITGLAEARLAEQERIERSSLLAAGIAALVMLLAAGIFATATAERRHQSDFVRFVHGGRSRAAVLWPTAQVAVLGLAALLAVDGLGVFPSATAGIAASSLLVADVLVIAILLTRSVRRLRRTSLLHP